MVLTDMTTSGFEDVDLLRRICQVRPHIKMIAMTAESTPEAVIQALREHAFSYFSRPFSTEDLAEMIERAVTAPAWDDDIEVSAAQIERWSEP